MGKELTAAQLAKIEGGKKYVQNSKDEDKEVLYYTVVLMGPSLFGSVIKSNSDTIWSRVEKPGLFKNEEMEKYAEFFEIPFEKFRDIIKRQEAFNQEELLNGRPIGREKYKQHRS